MIDPKKRLEEILNEYYDIDGEIPSIDHQALLNEILKEFVHKDNLPSVEEIYKIVDCHIFAKNTQEGMDKKRLTKVIRKLIEGKKWLD